MKKIEEFKNRINYWFDKKMARGTRSLMALLIHSSIAFIILLTLLSCVFRLSENNLFESFWDFLASTINMYVPASGDYPKFGYTLINAIAAIVGVVFTSILFGLISNAIELRIKDLRRGSSYVLEKNHIVVLGYNTGEHELVKQLILSAGKKKKCIVICTDIDKDEMEDDLEQNLTIPKNIEIICRTGDITKPSDLYCCSIPKAKAVIINALSNNRRIKALLAVNSILKDEENHPMIACCVSNSAYLLPQEKMVQKNIVMLQTNRIMAKLLAHTAIEPGLSLAYKELLDFSGNEFYFEEGTDFIGKTIGDLVLNMDNATLFGLCRNQEIIMNPSYDTAIEDTDELLLLEEDRDSFHFEEVEKSTLSGDEPNVIVKPESKRKLVIFGSNNLLEKILKELPSYIETTLISKENVGYGKESNFKGDISDENLYSLIAKANHIIILSDHDVEREDADVNNILLLLRLLNVKDKYKLDINITVEINMISSCNAFVSNSNTDFVVASELSSLVLCQAVEDARIISIYEELLSKEGNSICSRNVKDFNFEPGKMYTVSKIRQQLLRQGYMFLGYFLNGDIKLNPSLQDIITFDDMDRIIALGINKKSDKVLNIFNFKK